MLRTLLIGAALLVASGSVLADHRYISGHVVSIEPSVSVSINGDRYDDGFRVPYQSCSRRYWAPSDYRAVYVEPTYYSRNYRVDRGWRGGWHDRHDRDDHQWHERHEWREHHGYGEDDDD
jgi:hypothetical protein